MASHGAGRRQWWHTHSRGESIRDGHSGLLRTLFYENGGFAGARGRRIGRDTLFELAKRHAEQAGEAAVPKRVVQQWLVGEKARRLEQAQAQGEPGAAPREPAEWERAEAARLRAAAFEQEVADAGEALSRVYYGGKGEEEKGCPLGADGLRHILQMEHAEQEAAVRAESGSGRESEGEHEAAVRAESGSGRESEGEQEAAGARSSSKPSGGGERAVDHVAGGGERAVDHVAGGVVAVARVPRRAVVQRWLERQTLHQRYKRQRKGGTTQPFVPTQPWEHLSADLIDFSRGLSKDEVSFSYVDKYVLVVVCNFSRYMYTSVLKEKKPSAVIGPLRRILDRIQKEQIDAAAEGRARPVGMAAALALAQARAAGGGRAAATAGAGGRPMPIQLQMRSLLTDDGHEFKGVVEDMLRERKLEVRRTLGGKPQQNGICERANGKLKMVLVKWHAIRTRRKGGAREGRTAPR